MPPVQEEAIDELAQARARWRTAVAAVLAKSRPEASEAAEPERLLDSATFQPANTSRVPSAPRR